MTAEAEREVLWGEGIMGEREGGKGDLRGFIAKAECSAMARRIETFIHATVGNPRKLVHELLKGNPREMVMVCCAMIDVTLADLIATGLRDDEKVLEDFLGTDADGRAPLGSFGSRIQAAYLLRLISKLHFETLTCLKKIRNLFAHRAVMSFKNEAVIEIVKEIVRLAGAPEWRQRRNRTYTPPELFKKIVDEAGFGPDACFAYFVTAATMEFKDLHESCRRRRGAKKRKKSSANCNQSTTVVHGTSTSQSA